MSTKKDIIRRRAYKEEYIKNVDDIGLVDDDDIEYRYEVYPYINAKNVIENK